MVEMYGEIRQLTGAPRVWHAYVRDGSTKTVIVHCAHRHRSSRTARACAEAMERRALRLRAARLRAEAGGS